MHTCGYLVSCAVFGWLDVPEFIGIEQQEAHSLVVGYIKGGNTSTARTLEFSVEIRSETAGKPDLNLHDYTCPG